jgi:hypothetical protein
MRQVRGSNAPRRRSVAVLAAAVLLSLSAVVTTPAGAAPARTPAAGNGGGDATTMATVIEDEYASEGPGGPVRTLPWYVVGAGGVRVVYPGNLGAGGTRHPLVVFGNGSFSNCGDNAIGSGWLLRHLASWGFVVVCVESGAVGTGQELWAATQWLMAEDTNSRSVLFGKLDTAHVGAIGYSQGAGGAASATVLSNGAINSTVGIGLPADEYHIWPVQVAEFCEIETPFLFIAGQDDWMAYPAEHDAYLDELLGPGARMTLEGAEHGDLVDQNEGSHGYATAWLRHTLMNDATARGAFVGVGGAQPEVPTNDRWMDWEVGGGHDCPD